MITTQIEARALATTEHWNRFLGDLRNFAAEPVPLALFGSVVGPDGVIDAATPGVLGPECPMAHELVRASPM